MERTKRQLIASLEQHFCPNSTDGGGQPSNHRISGGECTICDRGIFLLGQLHGLEV